MAERPAKKARKVAVDVWEEAGPEVAAGACAPELSAEDLEPGAVVLYWADPDQGNPGWRGVISDAFVPLDEFWVCEEESGEVVRDDNGDIVHFMSSELELVARPPIAPPNPRQAEGSPGGVLIVGSEQQMMKMLNHFGTVQFKERREPQSLLAFPCHECEQPKILEQSVGGTDPKLKKFAQELRPDLHVAIRAYHLKHAIQELGPDLLRMEGFYLLSAMNVPYSWEDVEAVKGWKKKWRREVCNQIDVGPTARCLHEAEDATPEDTARRALGQQLGVVVSLVLWDEKVQRTLRQHLDVELPLQFTDVNDGRITVLLLPNDALVHMQSGSLIFSESPDADYLAEDFGVEDEADESGCLDAAEPEEDLEPVAAVAPKPQGKTMNQWEKEQAQFAHLPKPPADWIRVISQKTKEVYFFNKKTQEATFDLPEVPLPPGWTKQVSKSTGKTYYFHSAKRLSQFDAPTQ